MKCECGREFSSMMGLGGHRGWCNRLREGYGKVPLAEILEGLHPSYPTSKILPRLLSEEIKSRICEECCLSTWQGQPIPLELHHEDGNSRNHHFMNLKVLCQNCHALTPTWRARNKRQNS